MEKALIQLSASALRDLLNKEIRAFIDCLDDGKIEELQKRKTRLKEIFNLITEKELLEASPLIWSRNSSTQEQKPSEE